MAEHHYFKLLQLNEMVFGQPAEFITRVCEAEGYHIQIEYDNLYICISGIEKRIYKNFFGIAADRYGNLHHGFSAMLDQYFEEIHCKGESVLVVYSENKEIMVLFSPEKNCKKSPLEIAEFIHVKLQEIFEQDFLRNSSRVCNFTVLSPRVANFEEIAPAFSRAMELHKLSFFCMDKRIFTEEDFLSTKQPFSSGEAFEILRNLFETLSVGDLVVAETLLKELFLTKLNHHLSFFLCLDVLMEMKRQLYQLCMVYDVNLDIDLEGIFALKGKMDIVHLYEGVCTVLMQFATEQAQKGKPLSYIIREALRYMKNDYGKDISLDDIAKYVNVAPSYLSRVFNKEMKSTIPSHLLHLRVDKSKKLLSETNLRMSEIAEAVGISDVRYFRKMFKKVEGVSPQDFRKMITVE